MTIACGDSHTSTHGAVGAIAFGIGTTQVRDVLATQCLSMAKPRLRQVRVDGALARGVYAKDVILAIINQLGVKGGVGYAYEYAGPVIERMTMEERLTVCNMSIEGGARCGYVNPDATTIDYLRGRPYAPKADVFDRAATWWKSVATEPGARFDDVARLDGSAIEPVVTWGINPGMSVGVSQRIPSPEAQPEPERPTFREALAHMGFAAGQPIKGAKIDVAFVGSCTNGRLSDLRVAAEVAKKGKVAKGVRALIVPGSQQVAKAAEAEGLPEIFQAAGFQWRKAGCSMCLGMNPDQLVGREMSASSSNRNFIGRQGSRRREGDPAMTDYKRRQVTGRGIPVPGNDIDTDRIIPARFLKEVTFETMGEHAFEDARKQNPEHPFNQKAYQGASVLVVGQNFGCGSSREHAPQALMRWGIRAVIGGSFGEIFFGNCVMLGIPCLVATQADLEWLQKAVERAPQQAVTVDIEKQEVRFGDRVIKATIPDGPRNQLVGGTWDSTAVLLEAGPAIETTAGKLPYVKGW
jgi:3-isopropylmalate dehydratase large subunit/3-isopropylmalate dehydratase small subunit